MTVSQANPPAVPTGKKQPPALARARAKQDAAAPPAEPATEPETKKRKKKRGLDKLDEIVFGADEDEDAD